jgi:glycosyltransferase involved in cell wall biosynthesis
MPKYSIITPQYNSFDLMEKFFDSLENQTYKDFEVIIVDDCSTDGSYEKLQEKVKSSPLLITLKQAEKNSGPGNARNIGLDSAKGEWVTFIDNDDWVVYDMLERVDRVIELETVNCVIYDYYTYRDGKTGIARSMYINEGGRKTVSECVISVRNHTFGKFYKLSDCVSVRFPHIRRCEDVAYVCQAIDACGSAYYLNEPLYYYWQRPTSLSNNKKMDETGMLQAFSILEEKLGPKYPAEMKQKSVCDILYGALLMMCKAGKSKKEIVEYINNYETKYPEWWKSDIIKYLGKSKELFLKMTKSRNVCGLKAITYVHSLMVR